MNRAKFHKLYFPGLISLVFLPLMCIGYFAYNSGFQKLTSIRISWSNKQSLDKLLKKDFDITTYRKYTYIKLTGQIDLDNVEIKKAKSISTDLINNKDYVNGVDIFFDSKTTYSELIEILDFCDLQNRKLTYVPYDDHVYMFGNKPFSLDKPVHSSYNDVIICGNAFLEHNHQASFFERLSTEIKSMLKDLRPFWPSMIILLIMIILPFVKRGEIANSKL